MVKAVALGLSLMLIISLSGCGPVTLTRVEELAVDAMVIILDGLGGIDRFKVHGMHGVAPLDGWDINILATFKIDMEVAGQRMVYYFQAERDGELGPQCLDEDYQAAQRDAYEQCVAAGGDEVEMNVEAVIEAIP